MNSITEGVLTFQFPDDWRVSKFDEWSFVRKRFQNVCGGSKAVDILAIDSYRTLWIIEIKDFRRHSRQKNIELVDEVARKVRDTLAALVAASMNADDGQEKAMAKAALSAMRLHVVLHMEQARGFSTLYPRSYVNSNIVQGLKQRIKAIDPHPRVLERNDLSSVQWSVV